jgi:hypothetical protein
MMTSKSRRSNRRVGENPTTIVIENNVKVESVAVCYH